MRFRTYVMVRGFDLRIRTARDAFEDLMRRTRAWGSTVTAVLWRDAVAVAPPRIELPEHQTYKHSGATGIFVNLPRWKYLPFSAAPTVRFLRINGGSSASFDGISAQLFDNYEIVDITCQPEDEMAVLRSYLAEADDVLIAPVGSGVSVAPQRLVQQIQQLKSGFAFCEGHFVSGKADQLRLVGIEQQLELSHVSGALPPRLSGILGRASVIRQLVSGPGSNGAPRATTRHAVAFGASVVTVNDRSVPLTDRPRLLPYTPGVSGSFVVVLDQYTVGKIDYLDAYDRIAAVATLFTPTGHPMRELAAVRSATQSDIDRLAKLGLPFDILDVGASDQRVEQMLVEQLLNRQAIPMTALRPSGNGAECSPAIGRVFLRGQDGIGSWFDVDKVGAGANTDLSAAQRDVLGGRDLGRLAS
ncbi:hypothetical protein ACH473_18610 [Cellulosimicrobium funkei]|uniref:hypothetical protein n=1 Tax=Cellulosimicrobium funkei TaxID=264251 RepID=UPI0037AD83B6